MFVHQHCQFMLQNFQILRSLRQSTFLLHLFASALAKFGVKLVLEFDALRQKTQGCGLVDGIRLVLLRSVAAQKKWVSLKVIGLKHRLLHLLFSTPVQGDHHPLRLGV
jgi:hypothetical protein